MMRYSDVKAELLGTKGRNREEDLIQCAVVEHLRLLAMPDVVWYAVINQGIRSEAAKKFAGRMGLVPGVYDLAGSLPPNGQAWHLELKTRDGVLSTAQENFGELCERNGALHAVCYSLDDALTWLRAIGVLRPEAI